MKVTKELLEQYVKEVMKESWQQKLFGGEEEIVPNDELDSGDIYGQQLNQQVRKTNLKFDKIYGFPLIKQFYKLHRNYTNGEAVPEISQIIPMRDRTIDIVFADGLQEKYIPYGVDITRGY